MSERVPEGWGGMTLGDLGSTFSGLSGKSSKDFGEGAEFLNYMQVFKNTLSNKEQAGFVRISEGEKQTQVKFGDIIFTTSSETPEEIGMTSVFLEQDWFPYLNSFCFGIRPYDFNDLSPKFANYLFRGEKFRSSIKPLAQGSTRYNLSKENLKKLKIDFPPLPEQKKIASILTSVDKVIETTQKQIDKLQDLKKATMNELLTKGIGHTEFKDSELGRIPKSWEVGNISDIAGIVSGYAFSSSDFVDRGVLCIRMGNLYGNNFDELRSPVFLPDEFIIQHPKFVINSGDLLLSMTGTAGKRDYGFLVEVPTDFEQGLLNQRVSKIVPNNSNAKSFVCELMRSEFYLEELFSFGSGTKQANLSISQIMGIVVPIPPLDEQVRIGELISSIGKSIHRRETKLDQTQSLKKSLMQDLLTGKVRVQVH